MIGGKDEENECDLISLWVFSHQIPGVQACTQPSMVRKRGGRRNLIVLFVVRFFGAVSFTLCYKEHTCKC